MEEAHFYQENKTETSNNYSTNILGTDWECCLSWGSFLAPILQFVNVHLFEGFLKFSFGIKEIAVVA